MLDQQGADLVALPILQVFQIEVHVEPLAGPLDQAFAVVALVAAGVAGREVREAGHHRIFDLLLVIGGLGLLADELLELFQRQVPHGFERQFDAELVPHPGAGRAEAVIGLEELAAGREIDLGDRRRGLLQEKRIELLAADLLQLAVADGQVPARVGELGQGLPVPVALVFGVGGKVLFQGVHDLALGLPLGLVHGIALGIVEIEAAEVAGVELHGQLLAGPLGEGLRAVIAGQELVQAAVDLLADHVQHELLAAGALQDPLPIAVDPLPLLVHDLVVFQEVLAGLEVPLFDLLLRRPRCGGRPCGSRSLRPPACPAA